MLFTYKIGEGYFKDGINISKTSASISLGVQTDLRTDKSTRLQAECFYCLRDGCPSFSSLNGFKSREDDVPSSSLGLNCLKKIGSRSLGK